MRGFFGGLIIGLVTLGIAIVAISLLSPVIQSPEVTAGAPQASSGPKADSGTDTDDVGAGADSDLAELAPTAPTDQQGQSDTLASLDKADTSPADKPRVGAATEGLVDPGSAPQAPGIEVNSDAPVVPVTPQDAPSSPQGDTQPAALANPAQPVVPGVSQTGSGFGSAPVVEDSAPQIAGASDSAPTGGDSAPAAQAPSGDSTPAPSTETAAPPENAPDSNLATQPEQPAQTPVLTEESPIPQVGQAAPSEPVLPDSDATESSPQIAALPQAGADSGNDGPRIGQRVIPLTERNKTEEPAAKPEPDSDPVAGPPIDAFAVPFENPDNRPMMAIVLIDDNAGFGAEALAEFPYPLTFAIDPSDPDAAEKMARHRAAGFEVVAMVDMPSAATAQDAEVSLSVWLDEMPEVVAIMEGTDTGLQGNRELSDQVTAIAGSTGLGLIMQAKGLNTAQKLAAREGVPSAIVFRDFDGAGQSTTVMRRFLDQAAFRAGQQGAVIMLGRLRPDTISALLLWGLQDRASRLALAPVSAVLKRQSEGQ